MITIVKYLFIFAIGSVAGWIIELFYRHFVSNPKKDDGKRKWINPGFLTGPYLPLYGFGSCVLYLLSKLGDDLPVENQILKTALLMLLMAVALTAVEYIAGLIFIKQMKIRLWDYNRERFNIDGIICPLYSFYWMLLSAVYYFAVYPYVIESVDWLLDNIIFSFFVGLFMGVFLTDVFKALEIMIKIRRFAKENNFVLVYEDFKENVRAKAKERKSKFRAFIGTHRNLMTINSNLREFLNEKRTAIENRSHIL